MNFLAHLYLSGADPEIQVGNFIGDFVKGRMPENYFPERVALGIHTHRLIDHFTDSHPVVKNSKNRLRPKYRHYSGVIVDIFYDHFLARNWDTYHPTALPDYAGNFYALTKLHENILPERALQMLPHMMRHDWLTNYAHIEGIRRVLFGMSRRTAFDSKMAEATEDLLADYKNYEAEFTEFFPELMEKSNAFISTFDQKIESCKTIQN
jgi:acyl carrier protein phosphodiesterase